MRVKDIRDLIIEKYKNKEFVIDNTGQKLVEILGATFNADEDYIIRETNFEYAKREIEWYESQSLNVYDIPGKVPQKEDNLFELREENLKKHLEGELKKVDGNTTDEVTSENNVSGENNNSIITQKQIFEDLQLKTAIDIVRSLALMQGK